MFTPYLNNSDLITSWGIELKALEISNCSRCPFFLISSTFLKLKMWAFCLNANWLIWFAAYLLNCYVSILWNVNKIVSWMAIGLKSPPFFGMKTDLNLKRLGIYCISELSQSRWLNTIASFFKSYVLLLTMYFRCAGPIPVGPALLCSLSF